MRLRVQAGWKGRDQVQEEEELCVKKGGRESGPGNWMGARDRKRVC